MITVPDSLIHALQEIFTDPANDDKPESVRRAIAHHLQNLQEIGPDQAVIDEAHVKLWLAEIREYRAFKEEAEREIGHVAETFVKLEAIFSGAGTWKILSKLASGKLDIKTFGVDLEQLNRIGQRFAPLTTQRLKSEQDSTNAVKQLTK